LFAARCAQCWQSCDRVARGIYELADPLTTRCCSSGVHRGSLDAEIPAAREAGGSAAASDSMRLDLSRVTSQSVSPCGHARLFRAGGNGSRNLDSNLALAVSIQRVDNRRP